MAISALPNGAYTLEVTPTGRSGTKATETIPFDISRSADPVVDDPPAMLAPTIASTPKISQSSGIAGETVFTFTAEINNFSTISRLQSALTI